MPERGGPTTQSGILYQNSVTALHLGRLCDEAARPAADRVVQVRVEAPEDVDDTVVWYSDGRVAYIQAKERLDVGGAVWTGLWEAFAAQFRREEFQNGRDELRLVVSEGCDDHIALKEVCDRTRSHHGAQDWLESLSVQQRRLKVSLERLVASKLPLTEEVLRDFLSHVYVELSPLSQIERDWLPNLMPRASVDAHTLFRLLRDRVGGEARKRGLFTAQRLRSSLENEDQVVFAAATDMEGLRAAVHNCGALLRQHKSTLGNTNLHVARSVVAEIVGWTLDPSVERRVGFLHGPCGTRKDGGHARCPYSA